MVAGADRMAESSVDDDDLLAYDALGGLGVEGPPAVREGEERHRHAELPRDDQICQLAGTLRRGPNGRSADGLIGEDLLETLCHRACHPPAGLDRRRESEHARGVMEVVDEAVHAFGMVGGWISAICTVPVRLAGYLLCLTARYVTMQEAGKTARSGASVSRR